MYVCMYVELCENAEVNVYAVACVGSAVEGQSSSTKKTAIISLMVIAMMNMCMYVYVCMHVCMYVCLFMFSD